MADSKPDNSKKIIYIGDDASYWQTVSDRIKYVYQEMTFSFIQMYEKDPKKYQNIFIRVLENKPFIIYLDLSANTANMMTLAQGLAREHSIKGVPIVALVDKKEMLMECRSIGAHFTHVKCGEYYDAIYDGFMAAIVKQAKRPQYARAMFERDVSLIEDFRMGYVTATHIHVEGDLKLKEGALIEMETQIPPKLVPSKKFLVAKTYTNKLYFDHAFGYDLNFVYVDPPEFSEDEQKAADFNKVKKQKVAEYQNEMGAVKKKVKDWVVDHMDMSKPKKTKVMIIDQQLGFLKSLDKPLDDYPYLIRFHRELDAEFVEIDKSRPDIIAFEYSSSFTQAKIEKKDEPIKGKPQAQAAAVVENKPIDGADYAMEFLTALVKKVKSIEHYSPFVVVCNCSKYSTQALQDSFRYALVMVNVTPMNMPFVLDLAKMYEGKQEKKMEAAITEKIKTLKAQDPAKYRKLTPKDFQPDNYFIKKSNPLSICSHRIQIKLMSMTESEMIFATDEDLAPLSIHRLDFPVSMGVTVIVDEQSTGLVASKVPKGKRVFCGLIHSVSEDDKKKLRQFVNEVFFGALNDQRKKEAEEYQKLQAKALEDKLKKIDDTKQSAGQKKE